jgi:subtilisin family serine protease
MKQQNTLTGRGIRIAVVDSGVHDGHPHVGRVAGGVGIDAHGAEHADYVDRLGHGTAVAAAIREKAPDAVLFAVKVFDRSLATSVAALVAALEWSARSRVHLVNLSLGTPKPAHAAALREAVDRAAAQGVTVVSAGHDDRSPETVWFPGSLPTVIAVEVDWALPRDEYRSVDAGGKRTVFASGFPRDIPGVPREKNLHGVSFAVANATGFLARELEARLTSS